MIDPAVWGGGGPLSGQVAKQIVFTIKSAKE
jgi:hypothetical protein